MSANQAKRTSKKKSKYGISSLDMMGSKFDLGFPTPTGRFQTKMGGYVTLVMAFVTITSFFLIFSQLFDTSSPIVTTSTEFTSGLSTFNLFEEDLVTAIGLSSGLSFITDPQEVMRYITVQAAVRKITYNAEAKAFVPHPPLIIYFVPCSEVQGSKMHNLLNKVFKIESYKNALFCPKIEEANQLQIFEDTEANGFQTVNLSVFPCSLSDPTECASPQEVKKASVNYIKVNKLLISSNFESPIQTIARRVPLRLDPSVSKSVKFGVKNNKIYDDSTQLRTATVRDEYATYEIEASDHKKRNNTQYHCSQQLIAMGVFGGCQSYIGFNYNAKSETFMVRRSYKKGTTILGEFGGVLKLMTTVVFFIYSWYNSSKMTSYLIENVFYKFRNDKNKDERVEEFFKKPKKAEKRNQVHTKRFAKKPSSNGIDSILKDCVRDRACVVDIMKKLNFVELLENMVLDEHQKEMIPAVLMKIKEREILEKMRKESQERALRESRRGEREGEGFGGNSRRGSLFSKKIQMVDENDQNKGPGDKNAKSVYQRAFDKLHQQDNTSDEVRQVLDSYFKSNLKDLFGEPPKIKISPKSEDDDLDLSLGSMARNREIELNVVNMKKFGDMETPSTDLLQMRGSSRKIIPQSPALSALSQGSQLSTPGARSRRGSTFKKSIWGKRVKDKSRERVSSGLSKYLKSKKNKKSGMRRLLKDESELSRRSILSRNSANQGGIE